MAGCALALTFIWTLLHYRPGKGPDERGTAERGLARRADIFRISAVPLRMDCFLLDISLLRIRGVGGRLLPQSFDKFIGCNLMRDIFRVNAISHQLLKPALLEFEISCDESIDPWRRGAK